SPEESKSADETLITQQEPCELKARGHGPDAAAPKLAHHCRQLPKCGQRSNFQLARIFFQVVAEIDWHPQRQRRCHPDLEFPIEDKRRPDPNVDVGVESEVAWTDERVIEAPDRRDSCMRRRADRVLDTSVCGEKANPRLAITRACGRWRSLRGRQHVGA